MTRELARTAEHLGTLVIGAGQAGLAVAYELARREQRFVVLEAAERVGDCWRERFDSLRLYSPAQYDGLPGWPFPSDRWSYPTKDEVADYLERYAARFDLPVRTGARVDALSRQGDAFVVSAGDGRFVADQVVVATGTFQKPVVPAFARELDPAVRQLHSAAYRNPAQLRPGRVLVVGAAHSGSDIAFEVAGEHPTLLAGRIRGEVPFRIDGRTARAVLPVVWFLANHVLTVRTPMGRHLRPEIRAHGGPLLRVKRADLEAAGVEHTEARVAGVRGGLPLLDDGRVVDAANVVRCTGFGPDVSWIRFPVTGEDGWPDQVRGAATASPGLYFVGLPFLRAFASMLIGGVGRDAAGVARQIAARAH